MNNLPQHWKKKKIIIEYQFIHKHSSNFTIKMICKILNIFRTAYYNWIKNFNNEYEPLLTKYTKKFLKILNNYSRKRIKIVLIKEDIHISEFKINKIIKINGFLLLVNQKNQKALQLNVKSK